MKVKTKRQQKKKITKAKYIDGIGNIGGNER